jgi:AraC-like DNA-binding protein
MKKQDQNLFVIFLIALMSVLMFGAIAIASYKAMPRGGGLLLIFILGLALAIAAISALKKYRFSFHKSAQALPPKLSAELDELTSNDQFTLLCNAYAKQNKEFNTMSVERLLGRLLEDNSHTQVVENLGEHLQDILHSEAFGYRWLSYCLVYVQLEDYESYMLNDCNGRLLMTDLRRMYDVVSHAFESMLNNRHTAHGVEKGNACVFLVNLTGSTVDTPRQELEQLVDQLCVGCADVVREIAESFNMSLSVGVSTPFSDVAETHSTFEWLVTLRQYSDFVGNNKPVLGPNDFNQFIATPHNAPVSMEKTYYTALLAEDFTKAEDALYDLESYALNNNGYSIATLKSIMRLCLGTAEEVAVSNTISTENVASTDWRTTLQECETLVELNELIHRFFQFLIDRSEPRQHESSSTAKKIIAFLDENYTCPDLSIAMLSESLSLSSSYISRIFKRETGQSVPDYIHSKRVRSAKDLLSETDLSINDIALQVGYSTAWTLNRIFKRLVHMTPGAWRQLAQSGQEVDEP